MGRKGLFIIYSDAKEAIKSNRVSFHFFLSIITITIYLIKRVLNFLSLFIVIIYSSHHQYMFPIVQIEVILQ